MTRRIRRHKAYEITLQIKDDNFIRTPRESQRSWCLNRALKELGDDLVALDEQARSYITGGDPIQFSDRKQARLDEQEIMEDWQIPIMQAMASKVAATDRDVLEIGFGRGIASAMIQNVGVKTHTIVECNDHVIAAYETWKQGFPGRSIRMIRGMWQDVDDQLQTYDGIFFHTYPLDEEEYADQVAQSVTFSQHFFPTAVRHLRDGGVFTYLTNETDSLSRAHQRLLLRHFSSFSISQVKGLAIPQSSRDAHWSDEMVVLQAVK